MTKVYKISSIPLSTIFVTVRRDTTEVKIEQKQSSLAQAAYAVADNDGTLFAPRNHVPTEEEAEEKKDCFDAIKSTCCVM